MDHLLNVIIGLMLIVALLYGGFGVWDTWNIYHNAGTNAYMMKYKPSDTGEDAANPTLSDMQKINPDVCAWLTVNGTNIDYPVVQGESNIEYLNQSVDGSFSLSGSIFLDCYNDKEFSDSYSIIYGHHMDGEVMFGEIPYFLKKDYFQKHTSGVLFTPEHTYYIQWFACLETNAYDKKMYNSTTYSDENNMSELLKYIKNVATQYRDIGVSTDDRLVALSTCVDTATNGRVILVGRLS